MNDEVVAVEDFIIVGNILGKSWVGLCSEKKTAIRIHVLSLHHYWNMKKESNYSLLHNIVEWFLANRVKFHKA